MKKKSRIQKKSEKKQMFVLLSQTSTNLQNKKTFNYSKRQSKNAPPKSQNALHLIALPIV